MSSKLSRWVLAALTAIVICGGGAIAADEPTLRLEGIPDRLVMPPDEGTNVILTAKVTGGIPKSVWLARTKDSAARVLLTRTDQGEYQVNLADAEVSALLSGDSGVGQFRVFAEIEEDTLASVAVRYVSSGRRETSGPKREPVAPPKFQIQIGDALHSLEDRMWVDPNEVDRLIVSNVVGGAKTRFSISDGMYESKDLESDPSKRHELQITPEIRWDWQQYGQLWIRPEQFGYDRVVLARPDRLRLSEPAERVSIYQRGTKALPGSNEYVVLRIGDITAGQVIVSVRTAEGKKLLDDTSLVEGESADFEFKGSHYTVRIEGLINKLIGHDFAVVQVKPRRAEDAGRTPDNAPRKI